MSRWRLGLAGRLGLGLLIVALCAVAATGGALYSFAELRRGFEAIAASRVPRVITLSRLVDQIERVAAETEAVAAVNLRARLPAAEASLSEGVRSVEDSLAELGEPHLPPAALAVLHRQWADLSASLGHLQGLVGQQIAIGESAARFLDDSGVLNRQAGSSGDAPLPEAERGLALVQRALVSHDPVEIGHLQQQTAALMARVAERRASLPPGDRTGAAAAEQALSRLVAPDGGAFAVRRQWLDLAEAIRSELDRNAGLADAFRASVAAQLAAARADMDEQALYYAGTIGRSTNVLIALALAALVAALIVVWHVRHQILPRLRALRQYMVGSAASLPGSIDATGQDEIAELARAFAHYAGEAGRREAELRTAKVRLSAALAAMNHGVCLVDDRQRIVLFNTRLIELLNYPPDRIAPGVALVELAEYLVRRGDLEAGMGGGTTRRLVDAVSAGRHIDRELTMATGRSVRVCGAAVPKAGYILTVADITRAKTRETRMRAAMEAAEQASRAKSRFLATMSHELRTPLNSILGFSEIIRDDVFGAPVGLKYREYAGDVHDSATQLLNLISDILDIAKIEAGKIEIEPAVLDLCEVLRLTVRQFRVHAEARKIDLRLDLPATLPPLIADRRAITQIVSNLLSNSIKFTPEGGRVVVAAATGDGDAVEITVDDTGIGIAADQLDAVLLPFQRADNRYNRAEGGTGLGLALVKALAELHGGGVKIESRLGVGTKVMIRLPMSMAASDRPPTAMTKPVGSAASSLATG